MALPGIANSALAATLLAMALTPPALAQTQLHTLSLPPASFDELANPPEPDYRDAQAWAALPDRADAADVWPANSTVAENQQAAPADVFYIHPTTYRGSENWNQDLGMEAVNTWTDISVLARQASAFNACCKIYAPRYRQATLTAPAAKDDSGTQAYDLAYRDVLAAWSYYLENWNGGRPFMLVSHSQGTLHAMKLMEEEIDGTPLADRFIAGYVVGIGINKGVFGRSLKTIDRCIGEADTGCVASWSTYGRNGDASYSETLLKQRYRARFGTAEGEDIACWNPVGWTDATLDVPASDNLGALPGIPAAGALPELVSGPGARCHNGALYTDIPDAAGFALDILPGKSLHMHDFDLFYENIRVNATARTNAWFARAGAISQ